MILEFILAMASNVSTFFWIIGIAFGIVSIILFLIACGMSMDASEKDNAKDKKDAENMWKIWKTAFIFTLICVPIGCLPQVGDLWKVRLSLIKFELASPENIKAGAETIERVAHKIECSYLG